MGLNVEYITQVTLATCKNVVLFSTVVLDNMLHPTKMCKMIIPT